MAVVPAAPTAWTRQLPGGRRVTVLMTDRRHGDLRPRVATAGQTEREVEVDTRRQRVIALPWSWLHQVHGADVVTVGEPGAAAGRSGDALVTTVPGAVLAVQVADCVPVALVADEGVVAAVHVGWRGLLAGVIESAAEAVRCSGGRHLVAVVGAHIGPACYTFGEQALAPIVDRYGAVVRGHTRGGEPALDLGRGVGAALTGAGVAQVGRLGGCTACEVSQRWSHRPRRDVERQSLVVWIQP